MSGTTLRSPIEQAGNLLLHTGRTEDHTGAATEFMAACHRTRGPYQRPVVTYLTRACLNVILEEAKSAESGTDPARFPQAQQLARERFRDAASRYTTSESLIALERAIDLVSVLAEKTPDQALRVETSRLRTQHVAVQTMQHGIEKNLETARLCHKVRRINIRAKYAAEASSTALANQPYMLMGSTTSSSPIPPLEPDFRY